MRMKRLALPGVITLTVVFLFTMIGCSKSSNNSSSSGTLTCTINGTAFAAQPNQVGGGVLSSYGQLYVLGYNIQNKDTTGFQVEMPYIPAVNHPFSTDTTLSDLTYITSGKEYDAYFGLSASHGLITVSTADTVNHKIAGTFSGVLYNVLSASDSVVVTNGAFSTSYTVQ